MGGSGKPNTHNPEELFGAGYAACYLSALNAVHGQQNKDAKPLSKQTRVDGFVSIGKTDVPVRLLLTLFCVGGKLMRKKGLYRVSISPLNSRYAFPFSPFPGPGEVLIEP